jgi:putative membrane protein insertion efficiency factor
MRTIVLLISSLFISLQGFTQTPNEIKEVMQTLTPKKARVYAESANNKNEFELLASGLFLGYKKFISSQDASHCSFTPSCSEYAIQAIKKQGFVIGLINFFDRFSRCNGQSPGQYDFDSDKHLLIDPVRNIHHELINH